MWSKSQKAGVNVHWHHYREESAHGRWLQMTAWSTDYVDTVRDVAKELKETAGKV